MDASHFRKRAAIARELAQTGEDVRLARMLMELAADLDAEAEAIEAEQASIAMARSQQDDAATPGHADRRPAPIIDLTPIGTKPPPEIRSGKGSAMVLPFPASSLRREPIGQTAAECDAVSA